MNANISRHQCGRFYLLGLLLKVCVSVCTFVSGLFPLHQSAYASCTSLHGAVTCDLRFNGHHDSGPELERGEFEDNAAEVT